jgi:uncharacterized protein YjbI with pentapeptide repeats
VKIERVSVQGAIDDPSPLLYTHEKTVEVDDMANREYLKIIQQGVDAWNEWREKHPEAIPDLSNTNISNNNLNYANLNYANLSFVNFDNAKLSNANLNGANLSRATLNQANLSFADLSFIKFSHVDLSNANISNANIIDTTLSGANFTNARVDGLSLETWTSVKPKGLRTSNMKGHRLSVWIP